MSRSFDSEIAEIYNERFLEFGPLPEASMWYSKKRQFARFDIILNQIKLLSHKNKISVSDIGCGYGAFLEFLSERKYSRELHYYGYDVSDEVVKFCQKKYSKRASFYTGSIPTFMGDFIIMSGTYNFFPSKDYNSWKLYFYKSLKALWSKTTCAMIFNLQTSKTSKISSQNIYYANTSVIIDFCVSNLGPTRIARDNSLENDITFTVFR